MVFKNFDNIFFIGAGGIGMSALARYFRLIGKSVAGYDRTNTPLTKKLAGEGISVFFDDDPALIPSNFKNSSTTLVILTPAVKAENKIYQYFSNNGFEILKRSEILGKITDSFSTIAVAGTHGKTTVSTMIAHLLTQSKIGCTAFLGGISKNYGTNFLFSAKSKFAVAEADEFDRSFLRLHPLMAVITSADADHLDIYGSATEMKDAFSAFAGMVKPEGFLLVKKGLNLNLDGVKASEILTYALDDNLADFYASNIITKAETATFDLHFKGVKIAGLRLGISGLMNVENAVAACTFALKTGVSEDELRSGLMTFKGINRRFDLQFKSEKITYIDDYAHHPEEIRALVKSVRSVYPGKKITGIFQPHLFTRTRDFQDGFAETLGMLDEVIILDIYPAREKPIEGVTSEIIFNKITNPNKYLCSKTDLLAALEQRQPEVLLTIGAGDIDQLVGAIKQWLTDNQNQKSL